MRTAKQKVTLSNRSYQPSKAEMNERIGVTIPGTTIKAKMDNFARAIMRPAKIEYCSKK